MKKSLAVFCTLLTIFTLMLPVLPAAEARSPVIAPMEKRSDLPVTETVSSSDFGNSTTKYTYNSNGFIIKEECSDGKVTTFSYNSKNQIIATSSSDKTDTDTYTYEYDSSGKIIKVTGTGKRKLLVSTITVRTYSAEYTYTSAGKLAKMVSTDKDRYNGTSTETRTYTYDSKGNLTKEVITSKDSDGTSTESTEYTYDSKNRLIKEIYTIKSSSFNACITTVFSYNSAGKVSKEVIDYLVDGEASVNSTVYTYDSNGREIKVVTTDKDSSDTTTTVNTTAYDSKGNISKEEYSAKSTDGTTDYSSTVYKYNSSNKPVSVKHTSTSEYSGEKSSSSYSETYTYNSSGLLSKLEEAFVYESGESYISTVTYKYNSKGKVTKEETTITENGAVVARDTKVNTYTSGGNLSQTIETLTDEKGNITEKSATDFTPAKIGCYENSIYRIQYKNTYTYTGKSIRPDITVNYGFYDLSCLFKDVDYTLSYKNNKNIGEASIILHDLNGATYLDGLELTFNIVPKAPTSLKYSKKTSSSVTLEWDKVEGAENYTVYMYNSSTGKYVKKTTVNGNTATIKELSAGKAYKFYVVASDASGKFRSAHSKTLTVTTKPKTPAAPTLTAGTGKMTVKWTKTAGATGYEVRYKVGKSGTYKLAKTTENLSFTKTGLTPGKTYYFKVRAYKTLSSGAKVYSSYSTASYKTLK